MKPGGWGIFQVPQDLKRESTYEDPSVTDPEQRRRLFGQYDHVRVYGHDYFDLLRQAGFEAEAVDYTQKFPPEMVDRYRLAAGELHVQRYAQHLLVERPTVVEAAVLEQLLAVVRRDHDQRAVQASGLVER